ncbi:DUF4231 domain-containing protein [Mesomycoplasma molare]|uniref:DUF4231 domain-containing protein n=1 Tax=Mesomycoplasma molare TaxID=171288 RepID=A0ABY5TXD1_9BACT|nr:DUF4231 domain-containing protein [Mesomycoplasma molare]UWD34241.1 DUF4231 domain-containing protein [Mesomycoplasma molare]
MNKTKEKTIFPKHFKYIYNYTLTKVFMLRILFISLTFATFLLVFVSALLTSYFLAGIKEKYRLVLPEEYTNETFRTNYVIIIAWLSATGSFITSIIAFFSMNNKYKKNRKVLTTLRLEKALFESNLGIYKKQKTKETVLLYRTMSIVGWDYLTKNPYLEEFQKPKNNYSLKNIENLSEEELLLKVNKVRRKYTRKFFISYLVFLILNIIAIILSSLMIVFNLYSLRFNQFPDIQGTEKSILFLIDISLGSAFITLLTSISSFFSFSERKYKVDNDIQELEAKLEEFKTVPIEDLNSWVENISNYGEIF